MRINLGSGWRKIEGAVNVDLHYSADVQADLRTVEFPPASTDEVLAIHCVEHLERDDAISLFCRVAGWLKPGGLFVIEMPERSRCVALAGRFGKRLVGLKGLVGGRSVDKAGWHEWIKRNADAILAGSAVVPEKWRLPGEAHLYVWTDQELTDVLERCGFEVAVRPPQFHGSRVERDCRWEAVRCA